MSRNSPAHSWRPPRRYRGSLSVDSLQRLLKSFAHRDLQLVVFGGGVLQTLVGIAGRVVIPDTGHQQYLYESLVQQHFFAADGVTAMSAPGFHELGGAWIVDHVQQQSGEWLGSGIGEGIRDVVGRVSGNRVDDIGGVAGCLKQGLIVA